MKFLFPQISVLFECFVVVVVVVVVVVAFGYIMVSP